jgi:hypothetical protein
VVDFTVLKEFVGAMTRAKPSSNAHVKRFVEELGTNIDLKFALDRNLAPMGATAVRLCIVRAFGDLDSDKIPKKLRKTMKELGILDG